MKQHQRFSISLLFMLLVCGIVSFTNASDEPAHAVGQRYAGLAVSDWHERLKDIDPKSAVAAAFVDPLIEIVADERLPGVDREPFAAFLARVGVPANRVVPILAAIINERGEAELDYLWAARALALMGEPAKAATPQLIQLLFDDCIPADHRSSAVEALALIGPAHPDAIPALLRLLQYRAVTPAGAKDATFMRQLAADSFYLVGPDGDVAAPLLIRMVRNRTESESVRRSAIVALGALESRGAVAVTALSEELAGGQSPVLRDAAARALVRIGTVALPTLLQFLEHPDPQVRWRAAFYLRELKERQPVVVPSRELLRLFDDVDSPVRIAAAETSQALHGRSDELILVAIHLLTDPSRDVRIRAKRILLNLQPLEEKHLLALEQLRSRSSGRAADSVRATLKQLLRTDQPRLESPLRNR